MDNSPSQPPVDEARSRRDHERDHEAKPGEYDRSGFMITFMITGWGGGGRGFE
ncbi:hypothetical protein [Tenggerimyces flavus]|uniref:hypothetical protein n=1 Tax=Tenggerimyces flavus TaxID=1708749 RepID=UPI00195F5B79|nr:hypothetical protein [Tenggerimyces flavus]MBM7788088.1 hypothetical protein [Tenggerimyces flavus]